MIKVLIIDDSALVRKLLTELLSADPDIEVVGTANDPFDAREKIKKLHPDVLTLDVEMPKMDGVTFLRNLMRLRPMPVVMVSTLTEAGADVTLEALNLGAVDFVPKPKVNVSNQLQEYAEEIIAKVKIASRARVRGLAEQPKSATSVLKPSKPFKTTNMIIAIGASTGGTEAIKEVLKRLPATSPPVMITQHIPEAFSLPFSQRLDANSELSVCQAADGQQIVPGHAYVAPGHLHLRLARDGARYLCRLDDSAPVNRHKPSVDVMFDSIAQFAGSNACSVLLTGMGNDGAAGMGRMVEAGAPSIAQDEASSVVWGMPGEAVKMGHAQLVLPLHKVADAIMRAVYKHG